MLGDLYAKNYFYSIRNVFKKYIEFYPLFSGLKCPDMFFSNVNHSNLYLFEILKLNPKHGSSFKMDFFRKKRKSVTFLGLSLTTSWRRTTILSPPVTPCFPLQLHQLSPHHLHHFTLPIRRTSPPNP